MIILVVIFLALVIMGGMARLAHQDLIVWILAAFASSIAGVIIAELVTNRHRTLDTMDNRERRPSEDPPERTDDPTDPQRDDLRRSEDDDFLDARSSARVFIGLVFGYRRRGRRR